MQERFFLIEANDLRPVSYGAPLMQSEQRYCVGHQVKLVEATHGLRYTKRNEGEALKKIWMLLPVCETCLPIKFNALCDTVGVSEVMAAVFIYPTKEKKAKA